MLKMQITPFPTRRLVQELVAHVAKLHPDQVAIEEGEKNISYKSLNERANQLGHYLMSQSIGREDLVAVILPRSIEWSLALLGILKSGAAYLPIDPTLPPDRIESILSSAKVRRVLCDSSTVVAIASTSRVYPLLDASWGHQARTYPITEPFIKARTTDRLSSLAYVIYTSGSTGAPKGVEIEHLSLLNLAFWYQKYFQLTKNSRSTQMAGLGFDATVWEIWPLFITGGTLVLAPEEVRVHAPSLVKWLRTKKISHSFIPTPLFEACLGVAAFKRLKMASVQTAGDRLRLRPKPGLHFTVTNAYGPTECTVAATAGDVEPAKKSTVLPDIGTPIANTSILILDESLEAMLPGEVGELYLGGLGVARGYRGRPDLTEERFLRLQTSDGRTFKRSAAGNGAEKSAGPEGCKEAWQERGEVSEERVYKTGDLVRLQVDGTLEFLGRSDDQVKIRGHRIELAEIELALAALPEVESSVVLALDLPGDTASKRLAAFVVVKEGGTAQQLRKKDLRFHLAKKLPGYMVPDRVQFLKEFPLTPNGKVDKRALMSLPFEEGVEEVLPPRNAFEQALVDLWKDVLGIQSLGIDSNFFEFGGDSLQAATLIQKMKSEFKREISVGEFFSNPTILHLSRVMSGGLAGQHESGTETPALALAIADTHRLDHSPIFDRLAHLFPAASSLSKGLTRSKSLRPKRGASLLTGATGFLGVYLLIELLKQTEDEVICLIRAKNEKEAEDKLKAQFQAFRVKVPRSYDRVKFLCGDLGKPYLGLDASEFLKLSREVKRIYHSGAHVHHLLDYAALRNENVESTLALIELATLVRPKEIHYVSSIAAALGREGGLLTEKVSATLPPAAMPGYPLTKWASEKLLAEASIKGVKVKIYRPGQILGDANSGAVPLKGVHFLLFLKGCIQCGHAPKRRSVLSFIPVDALARSIVSLSHAKSSQMVFHLSHEDKTTWEDIYAWIKEAGYPLNVISYSDWYHQFLLKVTPENALFPLISLYDPKRGHRTRYDLSVKATHKVLAKIELAPVPDARTLFGNYLEFLKPWFGEGAANHP